MYDVRHYLSISHTSYVRATASHHFLRAMSSAKCTGKHLKAVETSLLNLSNHPGNNYIQKYTT